MYVIVYILYAIYAIFTRTKVFLQVQPFFHRFSANCIEAGSLIDQRLLNSRDKHPSWRVISQKII